MKKDLSVQCTRLLACFFVICIHVYPPIFYDGSYDVSRLVLASYVADAVALFWFMMGFFLFRNESYLGLWKKTCKNIILPSMMFTAAMFYFSGMMFGKEAFWVSVFHPISDYVELWYGLRSWNSIVENTGHLWYIYVYLLLILIFPIMKCFVDWFDEDDGRTRGVIIISFAVLIFNDISGNSFGNFSHHSINALFPAAIQVMLGHVFYKNKDRFLNRKSAVIGFATFIVIGLVRSAIQYYIYWDNRSNFILYWFTSLGTLDAVVIIMSVTAVYNSVLKGNKILDWIITILSPYTFGIYLIHQPIIRLTGDCGFQECLKSVLNSICHGEGAISETAYTVVLSIIVLVTSWIVLVALRYIVNGARGVKLAMGISS